MIDAALGHRRCHRGYGRVAASAERGDVASALADAAADAVVVVGGTGSGRNDSAVRTLTSVGELHAHGIALIPARRRRSETWVSARCWPCPGGLMPRWFGMCSASSCWRACGQLRTTAAPEGEAHSQDLLDRGSCGAGAGAMRRSFRHAHSLGLCAAVGARAGQWMGFDHARQRRISGGERGRDKTLAMTARFEPKSAERDLIAAIRRAARQEQFLEVVSAEAHARSQPDRSRASSRRDGRARGGARPRARARRDRADRRAAVRPRQCRRVCAARRRRRGASDAPRRFHLNGE